MAYLYVIFNGITIQVNNEQKLEIHAAFLHFLPVNVSYPVFQQLQTMVVNCRD